MVYLARPYSTLVAQLRNIRSNGEGGGWCARLITAICVRIVVAESQRRASLYNRDFEIKSSSVPLVRCFDGVSFDSASSRGSREQLLCWKYRESSLVSAIALPSLSLPSMHLLPCGCEVLSTTGTLFTKLNCLVTKTFEIETSHCNLSLLRDCAKT